MKQMVTNKEIKVSVILPVYNKALFLIQCIDGILAQTLDNIEIIFVDDGSTDDSLSILKKYKEKDDRIKLISQKNQGAAVARNVGLSHASGEYLSILDADDIFDPDMLRRAYKRANETFADIVIFRSDSYDDVTKQYSSVAWTIQNRYIPSDLFAGKDVPDCVFQVCVGWTWDKLFRREFVELLGLKFQNIRIHNDAFFTFVALLHAERVAILHDVLVSKRRSVDTSVSSSGSINLYWKDLFKFIYKLEEHLISTNKRVSVERSFYNLSLHLAMRLYSRLQERSKKRLSNYLRVRFFPKYKLYEKDESFFYNKNEYKTMIQIINENPYLLTRITKTMRYIKTHGIIATVRIITSRIIAVVRR